MDRPKDIFKAAILNLQQEYADVINAGESKADSAHKDHPLMMQAAENGLRFPELWEQTAVYIYAIFSAIERWGEWAEWTPILEEGKSILADKPQSYLSIIYWLGHVYYLNRNFEDALVLLTDALAIAKHHNSPFIPQIQQRLCTIHLAMGAGDAAKVMGTEALAQCQKHKHSKTLMAVIHNTLGLVALQTNEAEEAIGYFKTAVSLWQKQDSLTQLSRTESNVGVAYFQLSQFDNAIIYFKRALSHLAHIESPVDRLKTKNNLASIYYMQEKYAQSEKVLVDAIEESHQLAGMYHLRGSLNHNLGNTLLALNRFGEAKIYLSNSLDLWEMANDMLEAANTYDTLGELYQEKKAFMKAILHYERAIDLAKEQLPNPQADAIIENSEREIKACRVQLI